MNARVLVVDDNSANLELMLYLLKAYGFDATGVGDAPSALEAARGGDYDLTISDILMPGMDGYELARRYRESAELQGHTLIAVTALAMPGDRERLLAAGFDGYIAKPLDPQSFAREIESYVTGEPTAAKALVLIVDDEAVNRLLLRTILEYGGYRVAEAENAAEGLRQVRQRRPRLAIVDLYMPATNGVDFMKELRSNPSTRHTLVALHTATPPSAALDGFMEVAHIVCNIPKPSEPQEVLRLVAEALQREEEPHGT